MKALVIDAATEACSAALLWQGEVLCQFEICPQQHSQRLLPMIDDLLNQAGVTLQQLDCLGFGCGPGSFTGVRIATGILQGLALGADKPVVAVSTLAAMAQEVVQQTGAKQVVSVIDARMQEVYFGRYALNEHGVVEPTSDEAVLPPAQAVEHIGELSGDYGYAGTGWQAYPELTALQSVEPEVLYPKAASMLPLVQQQWQRGEAVGVDDITPVYLRDKVTWKKLPGRE